MNNADFSYTRCFNHASREAAARCTGCGRYFCRECAGEHDGRIICASCLSGEKKALKKKAFGISKASKPFMFAAGILILWLCFYLLGKTLLSVPSVFHEKTVWSEALKDSSPKEGRHEAE